MFTCIKRTPDTFYHYTLKSNLPSIIDDKCLKGFGDEYVWVCKTLDDTKIYLSQTLYNSEYKSYIGSMRLTRKMGQINKSDYALLKLSPRYNEPLKWFSYKPNLPSNIDEDKIVDSWNRTLAYHGNLKINILDILPMP